MNVNEIPASVPSSAARGVSLRMVGPMKAPRRMIKPMMNAHASPVSHALIGSWVAKNVGSMITSVHEEHVWHARAVRYCGDVVAPLLRASRRARMK